MSMEICVLSDTQLSNIAEWQRAIIAEGFPSFLQESLLIPTTTSSSAVNGSMFLHLRGLATLRKCKPHGWRRRLMRALRPV